MANLVGLYAVWDGKVLIHRRKEDPKDADSLKISTPGGGVDAGETAEAAAVREAVEEAGLIVDPSQLQLLGESAGAKQLYAIYTEKPELIANPSHLHEVADFDFAGVPGEAAGNRHYWAPIEPLIQWLNENPAYRLDYIIDALGQLKEKVGTPTISQSGGAVPDTITALSYNISWETMAKKLGWCPNGVDCVKNIKEYISKEGAIKDFVALQEASPIDEVKTLLPEFTSVTHKSGPADMILFYNKAKWKLDDADNTLRGEFVSSTAGSPSGRPFIALFFKDNVCVINFHAGHNDDPANPASDAFVNLSAAINTALKTNKDAFINKLTTYNVILMGDTNYPTISDKVSPYEIEIAPGVKRNFYGLHKMPTCCLKGGFDASGNPSKDASGNPKVMKLDEAIDQILSTWTETATVVGPDALKKDYSDHLPVTAIIQTGGAVPPGPATPGPVAPKGIKNDGNNCFFNATLQLYNQIDGLRDAVIKTSQATALKDIFNKLNDTTASPIDITSDYKKIFTGKEAIFLKADGKPIQSDTIEFISQIVQPTLESIKDTDPLQYITVKDITKSYCESKPSEDSTNETVVPNILLNTNKPSIQELLAEETETEDGSGCGTTTPLRKISHAYVPNSAHVIIGLKRMTPPTTPAGLDGVFNKGEVKVDDMVTMNKSNYRLAGAVLYDGTGSGGHYIYVMYDEKGQVTVINDDKIENALPSTFTLNNNAVILLYKKVDGATPSGPTTMTTNEGAQTNNVKPITKGLRRNINSEARQLFEANTGPKRPLVNEVIIPALNIFGDLYNLQKHDEMKAAPGTLTQFMTDYGINIDYGVPLVHLVKAFYTVFPDPSSGLPIEGFTTSPAFHVICNYLQYRILTLNFEIQLKRRSSPFREKLLKRSEALQAILAEGKCGTVSQPSALDAFLKSMTVSGSGTSDDCCNRIEAKMNFLLKMLQKSLGLNCDEIYAINEQIKAAGSESPDFDALKSMFGRLGGGKVAAPGPAPGPAPAPIDTEVLAKRIVELLGSVKTGSSDAATTIRTLTSDMKPNYKSIIEDLISSAVGDDEGGKLFATYDATHIQVLLTYFEHLQTDLVAFKEALNTLSVVAGSIDDKLKSDISEQEKNKLSASKYKLKQDTRDIKANLEQVAKMVNIVIEALKSYMPYLGPVEREKAEALLGPYLSVFLPTK